MHYKGGPSFNSFPYHRNGSEAAINISIRWKGMEIRPFYYLSESYMETGIFL